MSSRLNEFALGSTYKTEEDGPLKNAVTETGNDVDSNVQQAVSDHSD
jgi:hypothetical protein